MFDFLIIFVILLIVGIRHNKQLRKAHDRELELINENLRLKSIIYGRNYHNFNILNTEERGN